MLDEIFLNLEKANKAAPPHPFAPAPEPLMPRLTFISSASVPGSTSSECGPKDEKGCRLDLLTPSLLHPYGLVE